MTDNGFETAFEFGTLTISGDESKGFRPNQLLVSSLVGCSGGVLRKVCEKMRMPIEEMEIDVLEVKRNPDANLDASKMERAMAQKKNCSMVRSVDQSMEVIETFELL